MQEFQLVATNPAWTDRDLAVLRQLVGLELPMRFIAGRLGRSEECVRLRARRMALAAMRRGHPQDLVSR